jgi:hypothetical protein
VGGLDQQELKDGLALVAGSRPREWHRLFPEEAGRREAAAKHGQRRIG